GDALEKSLIIVARDVESDDEAGPVVAAVAQEFADALGHGRAPLPKVQRARRGPELKFRRRAARRHRVRISPPAVRWRHGARAEGFSPEMLPWIGAGIPFRTAGKDGQASSVSAFGGPTRPKKPAPSLL